ncbi:MAG: hypothetical protein HYW90_02415 [Candidatus Sungbacteria bacterium]|nr:hypothetical protein [Candidatus Sungbacteria bacterium]
MEIKGGPKIENVPQTETPSTEPEEKIVEKESGLETAAETQRGYLEIMLDAKDELPERMQRVLMAIILHERDLTSEEQSFFDKARNVWWKERFGVSFERRPRQRIGGGEKVRVKEKKRLLGKIEYTAKKKNRVKQLSRSLRALDEEKQIEEFNSEERQTLFYDDDKKSFYVIDNSGQKRVLGIGDVVSDYAWGITYTPDGEMPYSVFRAIAKRILINEARRDVEKLYDEELFATQGISAVGSRVGEKDLEVLLLSEMQHGNVRGIVSERACRELLTRISFNHPSVGFGVERSTAFEDVELKYDFKLRKKRWLRGVAVADNGMSVKDYEDNKRKRIGIQLTINIARKPRAKKRKDFEAMREEIRERSSVTRQPVDDTKFVYVPMREILTYYK